MTEDLTSKVETISNPTVKNAPVATEKCCLVEFHCYESASKNLFFDIYGTGIVKGDWCYLKNSADTKAHKKRITGKYFKIISTIEEYPENFDINKWQNEGESDISKYFISYADVKLESVEEVDMSEIYPRLAAGEIILADIAYAESTYSSRRFCYRSGVVLQGRKCFLGWGHYKHLHNYNLKVTRIYDGFPKDFSYQYYFG